MNHRDESSAFERLLADLSAGFIGLSAERIDGAIEDALRRIVRTLNIDRSSLVVVSPVTGRIQSAHSWARPGIDRLPRWTSPSPTPGRWPRPGPGARWFSPGCRMCRPRHRWTSRPGAASV